MKEFVFSDGGLPGCVNWQSGV
ncbi:hypothetical protein [Streptomyces cinereoruber]